MNETPIMIAGAGPTGLALALFLLKSGVTPRIIDKNAGPGQASRAIAVHARTLEFYRQVGIADELVRTGIQVEAIRILENGQVATQVDVKDFGVGLSPYPYILSYPQDDHERLLTEKLASLGLAVEWETELTEIQEIGDGVELTLRKKNGEEEKCRAAYLCGCDGARSIVRHTMSVGFSGGDYQQTYFVADTDATGPVTTGRTFNLCLGKDAFLIVMPVRSSGRVRLIGVVPDALVNSLNSPDKISLDALLPYIEKVAPIAVQKVHWFSTYRSHHRVADHFRAGRCFLLGDAGHIHSPVGGQGMNTGIGDAVNLAWKLAAVVQERADESLLETYELERIAFAHSLVETTDKVFQIVNGRGWGSQVFRETLLPHLAGFAFGFAGARTAAFRLLSQIRINYHGSALSAGTAGGVQGGDRVPWVTLSDGGDNFAPLESLDWQAHIYGTARPEIAAAARDIPLALYIFPWTEAMAEAGLQENALYLIRPDGYVALADTAQSAEALRQFLAKFQVRPRL